MTQNIDQTGSFAKLRYKEYVTVILCLGLLVTIFKTAILWLHNLYNQSASWIAIAARDYTAMWAAGHVAAAGNFAVLYDREAFTATLRSIFGAGLPQQMWPYPPTILLAAVPLSVLPILPGFLMYTAATLTLLWFALRSGGLTRASCTIILLSPAVGENALAGQNGAATAAALFAELCTSRADQSSQALFLGRSLSSRNWDCSCRYALQRRATGEPSSRPPSPRAF